LSRGIYVSIDITLFCRYYFSWISMSFVVFPSEKDFITYLSDERAIRVSSSLLSRFRTVYKYFKDKLFSRQVVREFLSHIRSEKNLKSATLNKYIHVLRLIDGYLGSDTMKWFTGYRVLDRDRVPLGDLISDKDMKRLCDVSIKRERNERETNLKYKTALTLMRFTGIPPVDLCNLTWKMDRGTHFDYYRQKTGKHMLVPIVTKVRTLLDKINHNSAYVFASSWGRMKEATLRDELHKRVYLLKLKGHITPYSFRYSMITWCYINGGEGMIPKISRISGHSVNTAMKHYAKFDVQVLIDALYATHPGLISKAPIDVIKRTISELITTLIDKNKYEVDLTITEKRHNVRVLHFS
jgi:integrase